MKGRTGGAKALNNLKRFDIKLFYGLFAWLSMLSLMFDLSLCCY